MTLVVKLLKELLCEADAERVDALMVIDITGHDIVRRCESDTTEAEVSLFDSEL